jgi:hypothetical protein
MDMALTKRQKMLVTVFFLGLIGLGADRIFLRPHGGAETAIADPWELLVPPDAPRDDVLPDAAAQDPSVAQRLSRLWSDPGLDVNNVRDPFCLPASWHGGSGDGAAAISDAAARFTRAYPLVAVVVDGHRSHALVGEHCLRLGQAVDGFTLVSVGPRSVVFERGNERVVLELVSQ